MYVCVYTYTHIYVYIYMYVHMYTHMYIYTYIHKHTFVVLLAKLCPTLLRPHGLYSLLGSSVHWIFQAGILEWVAISYSRGSSWPRDQTHVSCVSCNEGKFFITSATILFFPKDKLYVRNIFFNLIELHLNLVNMWVWAMIFYYYIHYFFSGYWGSDFSV